MMLRQGGHEPMPGRIHALAPQILTVIDHKTDPRCRQSPQRGLGQWRDGYKRAELSTLAMHSLGTVDEDLLRLKT